VRPPGSARVDCQFKYSKFLSQQGHLANDPENRTLEPRESNGIVSAYTESALRVDQYLRPYIFMFVDQSSSRRLKNIAEDIPTSI